jgi:hypothetical protein
VALDAEFARIAPLTSGGGASESPDGIEITSRLGAGAAKGTGTHSAARTPGMEDVLFLLTGFDSPGALALLPGSVVFTIAVASGIESPA